MRITLGITGSIAAYKACELVRSFVKAGDEVRVVMTEAATKFVTPLTFQTLSRNPVGVDPFALPEEWKPEHISLAAADAVVVAPATANVLAKMAHGLADDLLTATLLATRGDERRHVGASRDAGKSRDAAEPWRHGHRTGGGRTCLRHRREGPHGRPRRHRSDREGGAARPSAPLTFRWHL